ncbi:MAG: glutathione S-transferase family protein, partial [Myxococcota bacterium]
RYLCGSDTILRGLDELAPTPRLFPEAADARARAEDWMTLHYALQIDEYTFSHLAKRILPMRWLMPGKLKRMRATIAERADAHPELADAYRAKLELTDFRIAHLFKPQTWKLTEKAMQDTLDRMSASLEKTGPWLLGAHYSAADVLGTVLLSRVCMAMRKREIRARPSVARYWKRVRARPSFESADIWTRLRPGAAIHILRG